MHIQVYIDLKGEYRWRLVAANGRIMADSSEGYTKEAHIEKALTTIIQAFKDETVELDWPLP